MAPLISVDRLAELLAHQREPDRPVVLDVRWRLGGPPGREDYERGHLPGAVFLDVDTQLAGPPGGGGRHPLPEPAALQRVLRVAGVRNGSTVVAYDDGDGGPAARAWWLLRWAAMPARQVSVLDGGYPAWVDAGLPVSEQEPSPPPGDAVVRPGAMPVLDADAAAQLAADGVLLDARAPARYLGEVEPVDPRAGHIPGARNAPATAQRGADGRWLPAAALAERFAASGVDASTQVGAYCGSGVTAAAVVLALEHSGLRTPDAPAALYAGSWSHWCTDPHRPVATGRE
jgi:thiosulfate/3-mercaptopyruvate sulfurtransferase